MEATSLAAIAIGVLALLLVLAAPALGNTPDFTIRHWDQSQGLAQASVTALAQDADGFLWVGTFGGLARFDGLTFRQIALAGPVPVDSFEVLCLLSETNTLWVGTDRGLYRLHNGMLEPVQLPPQLAGRPIAALYRDAGGSLWLGAANDGVARWIDGRFVAVPSTAGNRVPALQRLGEDPGGRLLLWSARLGPLRLAGERLETLTPAERDQAWRQLIPLRLPSASARLPAFLPAGPQTPETAGGTYFVTTTSPDGSVWFGTVDGLHRESSGSSARVPLGNARRIPVNALLRDRDGSVWAGTDGEGLYQFVPRLFRSLTEDDGLPGRSVHGISGDAAGFIWAAFACEGLARIDPTAGRVIAVWSANELGGCPWTVLPARDGGVWVGVFAGLLAHIGPDGKVRSDGPRVESGTALFRDRSGQIWVGSREHGAFRLAEGPNPTVTAVAGLPGRTVVAFAEDGSGQIWIATDHGVAVWQNGVVSDMTARGLPAVPIRAFLADPERMWVGTFGAGLAVESAGKFVVLDVRRGLFENVVSWIQAEGDWIWWTGNQGVYRARREELLRAATDPAQVVHPQRFTRSEGMPSDETNGGAQPAGWKDAAGRLWIPTIEGLTSVDPAALESRREAPRARIDQVLVDGQEVPSTGTLHLAPGVRHLEIDFTAAALSAPERVRFATRLDGLDPDWVPVGARRRVEFTRLRPGSYTFRVAAAEDSENWGSGDATLAIEQRPQLLESWPFQALLGGLLLGLGTVLYRGRVLALRRRAERLDRLVETRTTELRLANADLNRKSAELASTVSKLDELASTDKLTGTWNRRYLEAIAKQEISRSKRDQNPISTMIFDIDRFKEINDRHGHATGDQVLAELCQVVRGELRSSDIFARMGGDEFVIVLPQASLAASVTLAGRIRKVVANQAVPDGRRVTLSLGVAEWMPGEAFEDWVARADRALYAAKRTGRDRVLWDPDVPRPEDADIPGPWAQFRWDESWECGVPTVDAEHRELLLLANALIAAVATQAVWSDVDARLDALLAHLTFHFASEEGVLTRHGHPQLDQHHAQHEALLAKAFALAADVRAGTARPDRVLWFLAYDVVAWHLLTTDQEFFTGLCPSSARRDRHEVAP